MNKFLSLLLLSIWPFFLIWSFVGTFVVIFHINVPFAGLTDMIFLLFGALCLLKEGYHIYKKKIFYAFAWVACISGIVEGIGTLTGVPFGSYVYTDNFGWKFFGIVPLSIPLAWWIVLFPLFEITRKWVKSVYLRPICTAFLCVWTDFLLEPMATIVRGYWLWDDQSWYYGVPLINFGGWLLLSLVLSTGVEIILPKPSQSIDWFRLLKIYFVFFCVTFIFLISSIVNLPDFAVVTLIGVSLLVTTATLVVKQAVRTSL